MSIKVSKLRYYFSVLDDNESGEITLDELGKFLRELFKEQIKELQEGVEKQKYSRAVKDFKDGN